MTMIGYQGIVALAKQAINEIDCAQLQQKINADNDHVLIDVREEKEWLAGYIPDAIHISRGILEGNIERRVFNPDAEIILYCAGGSRSALAAESLQNMGYTNVSSLVGGFKAWAMASLPIEH